MGVFLSLWNIKGDRYMFKINRYRYVDTSSKVKFVIYARKLETAEQIAEAVNSLSVYKIRKKIFFFVKQIYTDIPPYELECMQLDSVEEMRKKLENKR